MAGANRVVDPALGQQRAHPQGMHSELVGTSLEAVQDIDHTAHGVLIAANDRERAETFHDLRTEIPLELAATARPIRGLFGHDDGLSLESLDAPVAKGDPSLPKEAHRCLWVTRNPDAGQPLLSHHRANPPVVAAVVHDGFTPVLEGSPSSNRNTRTARDLDGFGVQHFGTGCGHLEHLLVTDLGEVPGVGDGTRISGVNPVDVRVDLGVRRAKGRRHCERSRVATSPTEGRDLALVTHPLIAGDDDDPVACQFVLDPVGAHVDDPGIEVAVVGDDSALRTRERNRVNAPLLDRHRQQGHGHAFSGREQHVQFSARGIGVDLMGESEELICRFAHGRNDDHDIVTGLARRDDLLGDPVDLLNVGHGTATVFLDDDRHGLGVRQGSERVKKPSPRRGDPEGAHGAEGAYIDAVGETKNVEALTDAMLVGFLERLRAATTFAEDRACVEDLAAEARPAAEALHFATTMNTTADEASLDHHESLAMVHLLGRRAALQGLTPMGALKIVPCLLEAVVAAGSISVPPRYMEALQTSCIEGYVRGREEAVATRLAERAARAIPTLPVVRDICALVLAGDHEAAILQQRGEDFTREIFNSAGVGAIVDITGLLDPDRSRAAAVLEILERLATIGVPAALSGVTERWREVLRDLQGAEGVAFFERFDEALAHVLAASGRTVRRSLRARLRDLLGGHAR